MRHALARVEYFTSHGSGGSIEYDEETPGRPVVGLSLENTQILDAALRPVGKLTTLRTLNLASTRGISDNGLRHLRGLVNLQSLNLQETMVSNAGLAHLAALSNLENLHLGKNPAISNVGLRHLHGLRKLRTLNLSETSVTKTGIWELVNVLPEVVVEH